MSTRHIVGALAALLIVSCFAAGLIISNNVNDDSTPLITTVLGMFSLFMLQLMQGHTIKRIDEKADKMLNGVMDQKIIDGVHTALDERESDPATH